MYSFVGSSIIIGFFIRLFYRLDYKEQEEAKIVSLAEHLLKTNPQFCSKTNLNYWVLPGCKGAKDAHPPQDNLQKERWASDEVTSLSSLFSRLLCSRFSVRSELETCHPQKLSKFCFLNFTTPRYCGILGVNVLFRGTSKSTAFFNLDK